MTSILSCETKGCTSTFQDELYGVGKRVMNLARQGDSTSKSYSCTVCGKPRNMSVDSKKKGK